MNLNVLPIYRTKEEQDFRKSYAFGEKTLLVCSQYLLPFSITTNAPLLAVQLIGYSADDCEVWKTDLSVSNATTYFNTLRVEDKYVHYFKAQQVIDEMGFGQQYIKFVFAGPFNGEYYTELFTCLDFAHEYVKLTWWDAEPFKHENNVIPFGTEYRNFVYLQRPLLRPQYTYEEETLQRDGMILPTKVIVKKTYRAAILTTEEVADALMLARLADFKVLYDGNVRYNIQDLEITPVWTEQPNIVNVEITFTTIDGIVKKTARSLDPLQFADYNNDYNNDYLI